MKRIYIPSCGHDDNKVKMAIAVGLRECKNCGGRELSLITPVKDNLDTITVGKVLGRQTARRLMKGKRVTCQGTGVRLSHDSIRTVQQGRVGEVGIAIYLAEKDLRKLDDLCFDCLIYIPWVEGEGQEWAQRWAAETVCGDPIESDIVLPKAVVESLESLTRCVNLSKGLGHDSDEKLAKTKFKELRDAGVTWDPREVEKWAVRNQWEASDAKELSDLSARYCQEGNGNVP